MTINAQNGFTLGDSKVLMLRTWVKIGRKYTSKWDFLCKNALKTAESGWV
jgi:hypothetical protein